MRVMYNMQGKPIGFVVDADDTETYYALLMFFKKNGYDLDISYDSDRREYYFTVKGIGNGYKRYQRFDNSPVCVKMPSKLIEEIDTIARTLGLSRAVVIRSLIYLGLNILSVVSFDKHMFEQIDSKLLEKYLLGAGE